MLGTRDVINYQANRHYFDEYAYKFSYLVGNTIDYIDDPKTKQCIPDLIFGIRNCKYTKP